MKRLWTCLLVIVVMFALLALAGCSPAGPSVEVAPGVKVQQNGGGAVTVTGPDGSSTTAGANKLPDGFPADAPIFQPSTISVGSVSNADGGTVYNVLLETASPAADVWSWYESQVPAKGWAVKTTMKTEDGGYMTSQKGTQVLTIAVTNGSGDSGGTSVSVAVSPMQ